MPLISSAQLRLLAVVTLTASIALPAFAQEDSVPESEHPGSDSPEAVTAAQFHEARGRKRAQAFLIPLDDKARAPTARVAQALERALAGAKQYLVVDLGKALASDAEPAQEQKAAEGRRLLEEANRVFAAHTYGEAVGKYKAAIKGLGAGLSALEPRDMADAFLRLAAAQQLSGDAKEAKAARDSYLTAALLDPQGKLSAASIEPAAEQPLHLARNDLDQIPIGQLEVETRPGGARIFIDGQQQGLTPTRLELTGGKHVLRLERTGFYPTAELVDVASRRETLYSVTLQATPGAATLNQLIAGAAEEANHGKAGEKTQELASKFNLDRTLIGSVQSHGVKVSVMLALGDPKSGQLIGRQELLLTADGTDADQVELDSQEAARKLFIADDQGLHTGEVTPPVPLASGQPPSSTSSSATGPAPSTSPPDGARHALLPGSSPPAPAAPELSLDEPGIVGKERHVAAPQPGAVPAPAANDAPVPTALPPPGAPSQPVAASPAATAAAANAPPPERPAGTEKKDDKKKKKDLHGKSGTEGWGE